MKSILAWILVLSTSLAARGADSTDRVISADLEQVKGPRSMVWQDCVGAGRVGEGLRAGWRLQLEECKREIGFNFLRAHGLLHDEFRVYSEDADGKPVYNWQYIDDVYDFLLSIGVRPFVELGFMPNALASGKGTIFWWNANITPPRDYAKWDALITALVRHWTSRYGADEVKKWRFEVWNEPQLSMFFQPPDGKDPRAAYFELYEHTAKAVRAVNSEYVVGGPSGAGPRWTKELIEFCNERDIPLDFISFHSYGLGGGPSGLDETGERLLYLNRDLDAVSRIANSQNEVIASTAKKKLPVYITEWSTSYSSRDPIHDSYFSAPFILEQLRNTEQMGCMSYWTFTDVFEENGPALRPFHGGFGLINYQDIRKPAFWAYQFLASLGATELKNADAKSYVCADGKGGAQVLFWDLTPPTGGGAISDNEYFSKPHPAGDKGSVTVSLKNLKPGSYRLAISRIGYKQNDPYTRYMEMGRPSDLSREAVAELKALSSGKPESETTVTVDGDFEKTLPMQENSVVLLTLEPVSK